MLQAKTSNKENNQTNIILPRWIFNIIRNYFNHFIINNAISNNTIMDWISAYLESYKILYHTWHHLPNCNWYIINLNIGVFLFTQSLYLWKLPKCSKKAWIKRPIWEINLWKNLSHIGQLNDIFDNFIGSTQQIRLIQYLSQNLIHKRNNKTW